MIANKQSSGGGEDVRIWNVSFAILLFGMVSYFVFWGLDYTNQNHVIVFLLATVFGIFMAFNIGGNDVANSFGTLLGPVHSRLNKR